MNDNNSTPVDNQSDSPDLSMFKNWQFTWSRSIARAWADDAFKNQLLTNPQQAFAEMGFDGQSTLPTGQEISIWDIIDLRIIESNSGTTEINIPVQSDCAPYTPPTQLQADNSTTTQISGWGDAISNGDFKMVVALTLPPKPDEQWQALALGDYQLSMMDVYFTAC